jgi:hypothetical protein
MAAPTQLLDFSVPVDVELLESTVGAFYGAGTPEQVRNPSSLPRRVTTDPA